MDSQPSSVANFIEPRPESVQLRKARARVELDASAEHRHCFYCGLAEGPTVEGIFVGTHVRRPVGEKLEFAIRLPDSEQPITGTCEVRWVREYGEYSDGSPGMGLRFIDLSEDATARIAKFVGKRDTLLFDDE